MKQIILISIVIFMFVACSTKNDASQYNKPAVFWYNKMINEVVSLRLDDADNTYISLESEHKNSPLLSSATFIIALAHMEEEEYAMANYYFDEYLKKFTTSKDADHVRYLKIKAKFLSFKYQFRDQNLMYETIKETQEFIDKYPNSKYIYLVDTIKSRLQMTLASFENEISQLYSRIDKPEASEVYLSRAKLNWADIQTIEAVKVPWYRKIFE